MRKTTELAVTVTNVKRLTNTADGAPMFVFTTEHGKIRTAQNTMCAYSIDELREATPSNPIDVLFTLNYAGNIIDYAI